MTRSPIEQSWTDDINRQDQLNLDLGKVATIESKVKVNPRDYPFIEVTAEASGLVGGFMGSI